MSNEVFSNTAQKTKDFLAPVYNRPDLNFVKGEGVYLFDDQGNQYLDCCAGIAVNSLGYSHPQIQSVAHAAVSGLWHLSNLFNNEAVAELAEALVKSSGFASKVHFSLCGASANEGAFKFARKYARSISKNEKTKILAFTNAFHGRLFGSLAATPRPAYKDSFLPLMPGVEFAEFNNIESVKKILTEEFCAVIIEPIQGEGGVHAADLKFLQELKLLCQQSCALLIYDEVQCGVGRTGKMWAWQHSNVAPDILTTAKPLANGLPIGAILISEAVAEVLRTGDHASTFAGGPFISRVALEVVKIISTPSFLDNVSELGEFFRAELVACDSALIKAVRGRGLLIGVELECSSQDVAKAALKQGLIIVPAGPNVVRFVPPLIINKEQIVTIVSKFREVLLQF